MSDPDEDQADVKLGGRMFGTCTSWDQIDTMSFVFYCFEPDEAARQRGLPAGDLLVMFEYGSVIVQREGEQLFKSDLRAFLELGTPIPQTDPDTSNPTAET